MQWLLPRTKTKPIVSKAKLSKDQLTEIFRKFDKNGDGVLSKEEVKAAFDYIGSNWPSYRTRKGVREADANGDGVVDLNGELPALVDYAYKLHYEVPKESLPTC